jgi:dihydrodipicolinate reductase
MIMPTLRSSKKVLHEEDIEEDLDVEVFEKIHRKKKDYKKGTDNGKGNPQEEDTSSPR